MVAVDRLEPWTNVMRFDRSSTMTKHRYADRFSIVRVETGDPMADAISKTSCVSAFLVSVFLRPVARRGYRLSVDGAEIAVGAIPTLHANIVDLAAEPAMWGGRGLDYVHFHVRRSKIDDIAAALGYSQISELRPVVARDDIVLAQLARNVAPRLGALSGTSSLALDHLELLLGAHLLQRYGESRAQRTSPARGLAAWQRRLVTELLRENLGASVRLADLARACELSVGHFARSFKASFGVTCHRRLTELRVERAQSLLARTELSLTDVATQSGFSDQSAFTRTFHQIVGMPPGRWRREHAR